VSFFFLTGFCLPHLYSDLALDDIPEDQVEVLAAQVLAAEAAEAMTVTADDNIDFDALDDNSKDGEDKDDEEDDSVRLTRASFASRLRLHSSSSRALVATATSTRASTPSRAASRAASSCAPSPAVTQVLGCAIDGKRFGTGVTQKSQSCFFASTFFHLARMLFPSSHKQVHQAQRKYGSKSSNTDISTWSQGRQKREQIKNAMIDKAL
jgi:hypothetical protein